MQLTSTFCAMPGEGVAELPATPQAASKNFPDEWFYDHTLGPGLGTSSGIRVSPMAALGHCPFWQGVNIIAGDIGQLPVRVQRREKAGENNSRWVEVDDSPIEWLLNEEPNDFQTPAIFKEVLELWAILFGNGCAAIRWNRVTGEPEELFPLFPERLFCTKHEDGSYVLRYTFLDGTTLWLDPSEVLHIRGLATDGFWGRSAVDVVRSVFGLGIAAREHAANTLRNGGRPSGTIETSYESIDDAARTKFRREWMAVHGGARGAGVPAILPMGMKYVPNTMSNAELALLELMKLDREQVASLLNLPAFKLNALENAAVRANVAESNRAYHSGTLSRHCNQWGEECKRKLILPKERRRTRYLVTLDANALIEGNSDDRMNRAVKGVRGKLITRNEGRQLLRLNPVEGGDEFENPAIDKTEDPGSDDDSTVETTERVEELQEEVANLKEQLRLSEASRDGLRAENERLKG